MTGWILYKNSEDLVKQESYEIERFTESASKYHLDIRVLSPEQIDIIVFRKDKQSILVDDMETPLPDFVLPRMGAKTTYFAFAVIRHLERAGVVTINNSNSIDIVKDKLYSLQILSELGFPIPKTILLKLPVDSSIVERHLKFPVIVKTLSGTQGNGVFLSNDKNTFNDLMQLIHTLNKSSSIILQEFIEESHGIDLRVLVVGGRVISAMKRIACDGNFKANYSIGGRVESYQITPEIEKLALDIMKIFNLDVAGIDLLFGRHGFRICEINSSPGFEGMEKCCGIDVANEILGFIAEKMKTNGKEMPVNYRYRVPGFWIS